MGILIVILGITFFLIALKMLRRRKWHTRLAALFLLLASLIATTAGSYWTWFTHRAHPAEVREQWFKGVRYERIVRKLPRPMVAHIIVADLHEPGIELVFTPPDNAGEFPMKAQTVSGFADAADVQVAINGSYFSPFHAHHPLSYFPRVGDLVKVHGFTAYHGTIIQKPQPGLPPILATPQGQVGFYSTEALPPTIHDAISGNALLLWQGEKWPLGASKETRDPRTAIGADLSGWQLMIVVVDGRQPGYSEGATAAELIDIFVRLGAHNAMTLDGGGSSTLVRRDGGKAKVVNSPINFYMPWWERPVANQLGIRAKPLP